MWLDFSSNGSLTDEAALITSLVGMAVATFTILRQARQVSRKVDEVGNTLNHIDEEPAEGHSPSLGQRVVRIERQVDDMHSDVRGLTILMTEHIQWESQKYDRLDDRIGKIERRLHLLPDNHMRRRKTDIENIEGEPI